MGASFIRAAELPRLEMVQVLRDKNREIGLALTVVGVVLLLTLRWWTSPVLRRVTGREDVGAVAFLLIPVFFIPILVGIALLLWEPEE